MVKTKKSKYFLPKPLYVAFTFDANLLPIKLSLPMVLKPVDWHLIKLGESFPSQINVKHPLSYLRGGYFCFKKKEIVEGVRLLSTPNSSHYDIRFKKIEDARRLCNIMNALQAVPFKINTPWLETIKNDFSSLVKVGLLMPKDLHSMTVSSACEILRGLDF